MAEIWQTSWFCTGIIGIKEFSRVQVRFLMLNTMCLTSLYNIQQDLINFIPGFSSLLMQMIFFLAFETNCTEFRHALFPRERDLYIHESNGNVRTYENQA